MDERMQFVARRLAGEPMAELCREFGISRKTGYQLFDRYQECGVQGLTDRSRRPYRYANQLPFQVENFILNMKREHPSWGARKIRERLLRRFSGVPIPAKSTVHAVLDRHGLVERRGRVRRRVQGTSLSLGQRPNDLWCTDYKGEFLLGNHQYCYPLTVTDHASRFLLTCEALSSTKENLGAISWSWDLDQFCAVLIAIGVLAGLAGGLKLRGTSEAFAEGFRRVALAAVLVGVARAVSVVLEQGLILDTITEMLFRPLHHIPRAATGVMMLVSQSALNFPMPSQSGQAMLALPILVPLADLLHVSRQVVVLVYQYATLICTMITPTYGALLAMLAVAQVPFTKWLRFVLPIYLILFTISATAIIVAIHMDLK